MRLNELSMKLSVLALAGLLPLSLTACADDVTGSNDSESEDTTGGTTDDTNPTNPATSITTTTDPGTTTTDPTVADTSTGDPTSETDTSEETDTTDPGTSSSGDAESSSSGGGAECGDGVVEGKEACDGDDLGDAACPVVGEVTCADDCTLDLSACTDTLTFCNMPNAALDATTTQMAPLLDPISVPDDFFVTDVNVTVDISHPWIGDLTTLLVSPDSSAGSVLVNGPCGEAVDIDARFDDEGIEAVCGDAPALSGDILPLTELSDLIGISSMGDWTFAGWDNFASSDDGTLNEWCLELTLSADDPVTCGDDTAHYGEVCDGMDLNGATDCVGLDMGFVAGELGCLDDCSDLDLSACVAAGCNGGVIDGDEVCDGDDLGGETCETVGAFSGGTLGCAMDCGSLDTTMCTPAVCGNDMIEGTDEECDGADLDGLDCTDFGGDGGTLGCTDACTFDLTACTGVPESCSDSDDAGDLSDTDPTFHRSVGPVGAGCGLSGGGTAVSYDVYTYSALAGETVEVSTCGQASFDTVLHVYQAVDGTPDPFNPANACENLVALNDDFAGCAGFTSFVTFTAAVAGEYQVVVTSFSNGTTGTYTLSQTCL